MLMRSSASQKDKQRSRTGNLSTRRSLQGIGPAPVGVAAGTKTAVDHCRQPGSEHNCKAVRNQTQLRGKGLVFHNCLYEEVDNLLYADGAFSAAVAATRCWHVSRLRISGSLTAIDHDKMDKASQQEVLVTKTIQYGPPFFSRNMPMLPWMRIHFLDTSSNQCPLTACTVRPRNATLWAAWPADSACA